MPWQKILPRPALRHLRFSGHPGHRTRRNTLHPLPLSSTYKCRPTSRSCRILPSYPTEHKSSCHKTFPLSWHRGSPCPPDNPYPPLWDDRSVPPQSRKKRYSRSPPAFWQCPALIFRFPETDFCTSLSQMLPYLSSPARFRCPRPSGSIGLRFLLPSL